MDAIHLTAHPGPRADRADDRADVSSHPEPGGPLHLAGNAAYLAAEYRWCETSAAVLRPYAARLIATSLAPAHPFLAALAATGEIAENLADQVHALWITALHTPTAPATAQQSTAERDALEALWCYVLRHGARDVVAGWETSAPDPMPRRRAARGRS